MVGEPVGGNLGGILTKIIELEFFFFLVICGHSLIGKIVVFNAEAKGSIPFVCVFLFYFL